MPESNLLSELNNMLPQHTHLYTAKIHPYKQKEVFKWAKKIAERYMGKRNAEAYGRRNSEDGLVLVRIKPTRILAEKDIADWDS